MTTTSADRLDAVFAALADPTRRDLVVRLTHGDSTVGELAEPFAMSLQAVSQHLKVLERAGLVSQTRVRQTRPCRLELGRLDEALGWIDAARREWAERMNRLDTYLERIADEEAPR